MDPFTGVKTVFGNYRLLALNVVLVLTIVVYAGGQDYGFGPDISTETSPDNSGLEFREDGRLKFNHTTEFRGTVPEIPATTVESNSVGFRDDGFKRDAEEMSRVAFLGDSYTFGWGVEKEERYSEVWENSMDRENLEVMNFALPDKNLEEQIDILERYVLDYGPDILVVGYTRPAIKDQDRIRELWEEEFERLEDMEESSRSLEASKNARERYWAEFHVNHSAEFNLMRNNLDRLNSIAEDEGLEVIIVNFNRKAVRKPELQDEVLRNKSDEHGWRYLPTKDIEPDEPGKMILTLQDRHPSPFYHEEVGEQLYNQISWEEMLTSPNR